MTWRRLAPDSPGLAAQGVEHAHEVFGDNTPYAIFLARQLARRLDEQSQMPVWVYVTLDGGFRFEWDLPGAAVFGRTHVILIEVTGDGVVRLCTDPPGATL